MGAAIENNLFADFVFYIPSGGLTSTGFYANGDPAAANKAVSASNPRLCLVGIITPSVFAPTGIGLEVSIDGSTWLPVYNTDGTAYGVTVAPSRWTILAPSVTFGFGYIRLKCGSAVGVNTEVIGRFQVV